MADKKISQLDLAAQINNDAVIPMSQENGGEETTYKALITALGAKIAEGLTFSNLATTAKNLVGAINELQAGGGGGGAAILIGTTTPSSSQGSNGNLYIQYTEGVGGADDTVDAIYVKLDGTWCEVTTDYADLLNKPSINNNTLSGNKTNSDLGIYGKTIEMSSTDPDKVADRITALETSVSGKQDKTWTYVGGLYDNSPAVNISAYNEIAVILETGVSGTPIRIFNGLFFKAIFDLYPTVRLAYYGSASYNVSGDMTYNNGNLTYAQFTLNGWTLNNVRIFGR